MESFVELMLQAWQIQRNEPGWRFFDFSHRRSSWLFLFIAE